MRLGSLDGSEKIVKESRRGYWYGLMTLVIAIGIISGAAFLQSRMHDVETVYQNELSKSQVLNQSTQQSISNLIEENERLRAELLALQKKCEAEIKAVAAEGESENDNVTEQHN